MTTHSLKGTVADIDIYVDAAGSSDILKLFMDYGKIEGRFVSVAINNEPVMLDRLHLTYSSKSIIGSGGYMPEDVKEVMAIMESGRWDIASIITHEYGIDDLDAAIRMAGRTDEALNVVIRFEGEEESAQDYEKGGETPPVRVS